MGAWFGRLLEETMARVSEFGDRVSEARLSLMWGERDRLQQGLEHTGLLKSIVRELLDTLGLGPGRERDRDRDGPDI